MNIEGRPKLPEGNGLEEYIASYTGDVDELKAQIQEALRLADILYMALKYDSQDRQWEVTYDEDCTEFDGIRIKLKSCCLQAKLYCQISQQPHSRSVSPPYEGLVPLL